MKYRRRMLQLLQLVLWHNSRWFCSFDPVDGSWTLIGDKGGPRIGLDWRKANLACRFTVVLQCCSMLYISIVTTAPCVTFGTAARSALLRPAPHPPGDPVLQGMSRFRGARLQIGMSLTRGPRVARRVPRSGRRVGSAAASRFDQRGCSTSMRCR